MNNARQSCQTLDTARRKFFDRHHLAGKKESAGGGPEDENSVRLPLMHRLTCTAFHAWLELFTPSQPLSWPIPLFQLFTHNESNQAITVRAKGFGVHFSVLILKKENMSLDTISATVAMDYTLLFKWVRDYTFIRSQILTSLLCHLLWIYYRGLTGQSILKYTWIT